jgi:hypothetical protein
MSPRLTAITKASDLRIEPAAREAFTRRRTPAHAFDTDDGGRVERVGNRDDAGLHRNLIFFQIVGQLPPPHFSWWYFIPERSR